MKRRDRWSMHGWSGANEMKSLDYMVSNAPRNGLILTKDQKITRLKGWLKTWRVRETSLNIDLDKVEDYANKLLEELK